MDLLREEEIRAALADLPGWERAGDALAKTFTLPSFKEAVFFVNTVAGLAEAANHHPDIDIRYRRVHLALTTHDAGGLTRRDVDLARRIEELTR
ncbi:MAG TPA: 4a-hydroxytetrahydrobiopterin dehydratase [Sphingobacteriaceae bacterium]|nr:4a-hydroxytetrahydrobiopterin dehydratase [Sphingobacteriaceae bacterium]